MKKLSKLLIGLFIAVVLFTGTASNAFATSAYYNNSNGTKVHVPVQASVAPKGATARCKDGSFSFSLHRKGTCSGHKGVQSWLK
jgi:hypothetical protein